MRNTNQKRRQELHDQEVERRKQSAMTKTTDSFFTKIRDQINEIAIGMEAIADFQHNSRKNMVRYFSR